MSKSNERNQEERKPYIFISLKRASCRFLEKFQNGSARPLQLIQKSVLSRGNERKITYPAITVWNFFEFFELISSVFSPTFGTVPFVDICSWIPTDCIYTNCCNSNRSVDDRSFRLFVHRLVWKGKLRKNVWKEIRNRLQPHQTVTFSTLTCNNDLYRLHTALKQRLKICTYFIFRSS